MRRLVAAVALSLLVACSASDAKPRGNSSSSARPSSSSSSKAPKGSSSGSSSIDATCPTTAPAATPVPTGSQGSISFDDATSAMGLVDPLTGMMGHAVAVGDVNGDGFPDLFVGGFANRSPDMYAVRGATGPSPDRLLLGSATGFTVDAGFQGTLGRTSSAAFVDLDGDGRPDLVVARNRESTKKTATDIDKAPTTIYRNDGDGKFTDMGTVGPTELARAVTAFDLDGDGKLDLLIGQDSPTGSVALLHNDGNFHFTDVTAKSGLPSPLIAFGIAAADLNGDGHIDLAVAGSNKIFLGDGKGSFRDATPSSFAWPTYGDEDLVTGVTVGDLDGDGRPDLVVGHHYGSTLKGHPTPVRVFLNRGNDDSGAPKWDDITQSSGVPAFSTKSPHVEIADFDNDGRPDVLVTSSADDGSRPVVLHNEGVQSDTHAPKFTAPPGLGNPQYWVTGAVFDADRDGRLDVFVAEWCATKPSLLLRNTTTSGHWIDVDLSATPLGGIGSFVQVFRAGGAGQSDALLGDGWVTASTGYGAGAAPVVHVGLAATTTVDVVVHDANGHVTTLSGQQADQRVLVHS